MHELAHAIFDAESAGAALDFSEPTDRDELIESRADAFAQEALVPKEVLRHISQRHGINWDCLMAKDLAQLVAALGVEQTMVTAAAIDNGFINEESAARVNALDISVHLRELSERALSTKEYIRLKGGSAEEWIAKRTTTIPGRSLRLPSRFVDGVVCAFRDGVISAGKAARWLMIDEREFADRFGAMSLEYAE